MFGISLHSMWFSTGMKKILSILLACCLLAGAVPALAVDAGEARAVIGANLTEEQISAVYSNFGVKRGDVTELRVTNADERKYLEGYVEDSVIGTNSISCVYIEVLEEGEGLDVTTSNINWCTSQMYVSALALWSYAATYSSSLHICSHAPRP